MTNITKLFTKEDRFNIHKILGGSCIIHFIYRLYLWALYRQMFFEFDFTTVLYLCMHCCLSLSSFIFKIPKKKVSSRLVIWEETRWHSLIFSLRSILSCLVLVLYSLLPSIYYTYYIRSILVILTMMFADVSTKYYKQLHIIPDGDSVMRNIPYPQDLSLSTISYLKYFYSVAQIGATLVCLFSMNIDKIFIVLLPIQFSMFISTLSKKGIISMHAWHILYVVSLLTVAMINDSYIYTYSYNLWTRVFYLFVIITRLHLGINKYIIWSLVITSGIFLL